MMGALFTKTSILKKLEVVYWHALNGGKLGNLHVALRVIELQGKHIGLFEKQPLPKVSRIADMTEEQLVEFIDRLEARDPSLKEQEAKPPREGYAPEKEPGGQATNLETSNLQGEAAPEEKHEDSADATEPLPSPHSSIAGRREPWVWKPADTPYPEEKNPAAEPVVDNRPHREREKPPPIVWSIP